MIRRPSSIVDESLVRLVGAGAPVPDSRGQRWGSAGLPYAHPVVQKEPNSQGPWRAKQTQFQAGGGGPETGAGLPMSDSLQSSAWMRQTNPIRLGRRPPGGAQGRQTKPIHGTTTAEARPQRASGRRVKQSQFRCRRMVGTAHPTARGQPAAPNKANPVRTASARRRPRAPNKPNLGRDRRPGTGAARAKQSQFGSRGPWRAAAPTASNKANSLRPHMAGKSETRNPEIRNRSEMRMAQTNKPGWGRARQTKPISRRTKLALTAF
jgi:hypothetical protein